MGVGPANERPDKNSIAVEITFNCHAFLGYTLTVGNQTWYCRQPNMVLDIKVAEECSKIIKHHGDKEPVDMRDEL